MESDSVNWRKVLAVLLFAFFLLLQYLEFTPYAVTQTYISSQNVPHTVVINRGWKCYEDIGYSRNIKNDNPIVERERIDFSVAVLQILLSGGVCVWVYIKPKIAQRKGQKQVNSETETLKALNNQLQKSINVLSAENKRLLTARKKYEDALRDYYESVPEFPQFDVYTYAFADDKTINEAKRKYAEEMYKYVIYRTQHK